MSTQEILQNIITTFEVEKFQGFFRNKSRTFKPVELTFDGYNNENFTNCKAIGQLEFNDGIEMLISSVRVTNSLTERTGKKAQFQLAKRILKDTDRYSSGIFIFYDANGNFRFSLVYDIPSFDGRRTWSNFRRYTYYVSKEQTNKTFLQQMEEADFSTLENVIEAFSVEKVTKEFYREIANWYFWALKHVKFPEDAEAEENGRNIATIRLITRLIFIWFMKVRKLVPDELFDEKNLKSILKKFELKNDNYYKAILQNLFFATLNTKQADRRFTSKRKGYRGFSTDFGNHNVYRYEEEFINSEEVIEKYFMPIPFLNGGLFECLDYKSRSKEERKYIDGFTSIKREQPKVPNFLFFADETQVDLNKEYGTTSKEYTVRGLIKTLSLYNFTIDENDPKDVDVALDPELLGRVFENLLASYNPETAETARKSTGSYYTPRQIVDYMVDESLKQYFKTHLKESTDSIHAVGNTIGTDNIPVVGNRNGTDNIPVVGNCNGTDNIPVVGNCNGTDNIPVVGNCNTGIYPFLNPHDEINIYHSGNLPHWQQQNVWYFVTFRLADSLPVETVEAIKREREQWLLQHKRKTNEPYSLEEVKEYYKLFSERVEKLLDDCQGSCVLHQENIAKIVADALMYFNNKKYVLDDWVIMPNHVHILVKPLPGYALPEITHSWKSYTANEINKVLGKSGQLWLHESYDHIVRNEEAFYAIKNYIRNNPIKANLNLASCAQSWTCKSADSIPAVGNIEKVPTTSLLSDPLKTGIESSDALDTALDTVIESKDALDTLFSDEEGNPFDEATTEKLVSLIDSLRAVDPAVGSGAFPMRLLNRLVFLLHKLDPDNQLWKKSQIDGIKKSVKDPILQRKFIEQIEKKFSEKNPDFGRKLYLIEKCIYGVDIQQIAVEIAKLRFFISLLVDEKIDFTKPNENYGIEPLPNLDFKLMQGNSLISSFAGIDFNTKTDEKDNLFTFDNRYKKLIEEFEELKSQYQNEPDVEAKRRLKDDIDKKLLEIFEEKLNQHFPQINDIKEKAAKFPNEAQQKKYIEIEKNNLFKKIGIDLDQAEKDLIAYTEGRRQKNFFLWDVYFAEVFTEKNGFDIVIGNPPYVSTKGVSESDKKVLMKQFGFADDLYNHFYFKGIELLKEKGLLTYISSKTFWTIQTKKNLRQLILENKLLQLVDTANPFESAMVDTCITIVQKDKANDYEIHFIDISNGWDKKQEYKVKDNVYKNVVNNVFFKPNKLNMKIYEQVGKKLKLLVEQWWDKISTSKNIEKYKRELEQYRQSLKPGDITLLGLITEGGQGLATANNGKFIGVLEGTKWADKLRQERAQKLWEFIQSFSPKEISKLKSKSQVQDYLNNLSENQIRELFDSLKEKYGRDIFGQGWLYRIVSQDEIADVEKLTDDEKLNGIKGKKTFVPYDKGDKDGNRWWAPTPYYIDWSRENVKFLKENSGKKGEGMPVVRNPQFYFREGFCWSDIHTKFIKCRKKERGIHDVKSMSLFSLDENKYPDFYFVTIINSTLVSEYVEAFIKNTQTFQINDARQLPIVIPTPEQLKEFELIFDQAKRVQEEKFFGKISENEAEQRLEKIQMELDEKVIELYGIN